MSDLTRPERLAEMAVTIELLGRSGAPEMIKEMFYEGLIDRGAKIYNISAIAMEHEVLDIYYMIRDTGYFAKAEFEALVEFSKNNPVPELIDPQLKAFVQFVKNDSKARFDGESK